VRWRSALCAQRQRFERHRFRTRCRRRRNCRSDWARCFMSSISSLTRVIGLLSLMLLQESRRAARTSPTGELILLENQDRSLWDREQIAEGVALLENVLSSQRFGSYTLQAAI